MGDSERIEQLERRVAELDFALLDIKARLVTIGRLLATRTQHPEGGS